jgi:diguanylate cyclase (GGDEF)-like protein
MLGAIVSWMIAVRFGPEPRTSVAPPMPEDLIGSDTATHIAANTAVESTFEPLAFVLIERCAARVMLPCALVMREKPGAPAYITAVAGGLDNRLLGQEVPLESPAGKAILTGLPEVGPRDEKVIAFAKGDRRKYSGGGISVPLGQGANIYGCIVAFGESSDSKAAIDAMTDEARKFMPVIVPAYSAALSARRAETDELTGLANRRVLKRAFSRSNGGERASLIVVDIDHFKTVNDTLGHQAGDAALRHVAKLVRDAVRPNDTAARIGGEEFAVWLPGADQRTGEEVAERLRASVAGSPFRYGGQQHTITVSVGVASYPQPIRAIENLMGAADTALYSAKRGGRNQVVASKAQAG